MNYSAYPDHCYPFSHSDADVSHVASTSESRHQKQENDAAISMVNFMLAASSNLIILLRKPRKSRRKVNLKKYLDRQLKRRLSKLKTIGKSAPDLSSSSLRTSASKDRKNVGWDWLLDEEDIDEDEEDRSARGSSRGYARSKSTKSTKKVKNGGSKSNITSNWKPSTTPRAPLQNSYQTRNQTTSLDQLQHEEVINDAIGDNILDFLDRIGCDSVSENSDSMMSDSSLYSGLPTSSSPVVDHVAASGYTSTVLPPISTFTTPKMYGQRGELKCQYSPHHHHVVAPSTTSEQHFMQQQPSWSEYDANPSPTLPPYPTTHVDLPLQLASIPTDQLLLPQAAVYY